MRVTQWLIIGFLALVLTACGQALSAAAPVEDAEPVQASPAEVEVTEADAETAAEVQAEEQVETGAEAEAVTAVEKAMESAPEADAADLIKRALHARI